VKVVELSRDEELEKEQEKEQNSSCHVSCEFMPKRLTSGACINSIEFANVVVAQRCVKSKLAAGILTRKQPDSIN